MKDFKGIHEEIVQSEYDFREGWMEKYEIGTALWFAAGFFIGWLLRGL